MRWSGASRSTLAVAQAILDFDPSLQLVVLGGLGGAQMTEWLSSSRVKLVFEGFPDRAYLPDGRLVPRNLPNAVIDNPEIVARRAVRMAQDSVVEAIDGSLIQLDVQTLCIHGDNPSALQIAQSIDEEFTKAGIIIQQLAA